MPRLLRIILLPLFIGVGTMALAQAVDVDGTSTGMVKGRIVNGSGTQPVPDVQLTMPYLKLMVNSDAEGNFSFSRVPYGTHTIIIGGSTVSPDTFKVNVHDAVANLNDVTVTMNEAGTTPISNQIPVIALEENSMSTDDDGVRTSNVSGLLSASRDPFVSAVAFVFGPYRFQARGYERNSQEVQINGTPMNDIETGDAYWSQWGGLNDVFRSMSNSYGLQLSEYAFGNVTGSVYFDAAAATQRKQTRVTYSASNRAYRNRLMFTHSTGINANGWAYSVSLSKRWAKEGYIPGTFYDGYSYYAGISKRMKEGKHQVSLTTFGAPTRRGKASPATQESYDIAGTNYYNPNWGYQNGEKRNARVADIFQPLNILSYVYAPGNTLRWTTSIAYQFGKSKNTILDWFDAASPRPDYYQYLPGWHTINGWDPAGARFNAAENQQIKWEDLYNANYINHDTVENANGVAGSTVSGKRSSYIIGADVDDIKKYTFNTTLEKVFGDHFTVQGGLQFVSQRTESYKELVDLLGGDYYLNLNQFAVQQNVPELSFNQYDLNTPNRIIKEGDKYQYHYLNHFNKGFIWAQGVATFNRLDLFLAVRGGYNDFSREGFYRSGLFPNSSFGKSEVQRFTTINAKGGITYKLDGRNYIFVNGAIRQDAPGVDNTFISPRTRNTVVDAPTVQETSSIEAGYLMRTPKYNLRAVGYATQTAGAVEIKRYYNDELNSFVNYVMQGISTRFTGVELAAEVKLSPVVAVIGVAAIGQSFYTDNPKSINIYTDNDTLATPVGRQVYIKNYFLANGPQSAYTAGLRYGPWKYFYGNLNFNYFDNNYVDVSPDQRSVDAIEGVPVGSPLYHSILDQEKLPSAFTVDLSVSKSILLSKLYKQLPRNVFLYLNVGISNLLNNKKVTTGGFEQLRYEFSEREPDRFATKYFYGFGRNFFLNISLKF
jgi:hypothetical protein